MSRPPVTTRRLVIVMAPAIAAAAATAVVLGPRYPFAAFLFTAGILCVSAAALPAPAWSWWLQVAGKVLKGRRMPRWARIYARMAVSQIVREPKGPRPAEGTRKARVREWRERLYFHLSRAEWDSRVQIGMSFWHCERLAYRLPNPEQWDELEDLIWPSAEWVGEIEAHWREQEWRRGQ